MSVLGSQLEIDMDPEGDAVIIPRHQGNTGTGCYKLFDHDIEETRRVMTIAGMAPYFRPNDKDLDNQDDDDDEKDECKERSLVLVQHPFRFNRNLDMNIKSEHQEHLLDAPILSPTSDFASNTTKRDPKQIYTFGNSSEKEVGLNPFDYGGRHSSDALDSRMGPANSGSMEMMQFRQRTGVQRTGSTDGTVEQMYKSLDRFGSLDSEDTFLSCNSHPFPSQGSLAGLEELAAMGTMAPNGSMPAVNIPSFNSAMGYSNPMDSTTKSHALQSRRRGRGQQVGIAPPIPPRGQRNHGGALTPSPQGSPLPRRVRIAGNRSASSDAELEWDERVSGPFFVNETEDGTAPKHKRIRVSQGASKSRPRFDVEGLSPEDGLEAPPNFQDDPKRRPSYMPTRGIAAVLNQGLASLGEKLGKGSKNSLSSTETLDAILSRRSLVSSPSDAKKRSILKKSESGSSRSVAGSVIVVGTSPRTGPGSDPEKEILLLSDPESSAAETPVATRKKLIQEMTPSSGEIVVVLPPTELNCEKVKNLVGPKLKTSGSIINRGTAITSHDQNNQNNNGGPLTIKFVKLPDDDHDQQLAASNNVNNNVPYRHEGNLGQDCSKKSNGMTTSKEIQTSTANISVNLSSSVATPATNRKFERGRDPHRQRTSPSRGAEEDEKQQQPPPTQQCEPQSQSQNQATTTTRCSNLNCRQNTPSSSKHLLCVCGSLMMKVRKDHQGNDNNKPFQTSQSDETKKSFEMSS